MKLYYILLGISVLDLNFRIDEQQKRNRVNARAKHLVSCTVRSGATWRNIENFSCATALLSHAKAGEDGGEDVGSGYCAGYCAEMMQYFTEILCDEVTGESGF